MQYVFTLLGLIESAWGRSKIEMRKLVVAGLLIGAAWVLSGCLTMPPPSPEEAIRIADFAQCFEENRLFGLIPDFKITFNRHMDKCMRQVGWYSSDPHRMLTEWNRGMWTRTPIRYDDTNKYGPK